MQAGLAKQTCYLWSYWSEALRRGNLHSPRNRGKSPVIDCPVQYLGDGFSPKFGWWFLLQPVEGQPQIVRFVSLQQSGGMILFAQFLPLAVGGQWQMGTVDRRALLVPISETVLQIDLSRCRVEQIRAAHYMRDALKLIIHCYCQLIGDQTVATPDHKVADIGAQVLLVTTHNQIIKSDINRVITVRYSQAERRFSRDLTLAAVTIVNAPDFGDALTIAVTVK